MNIRSAVRRLRYFVFRDQATRDLEEEMRIHVEMRAEELNRAGMSGGEANVAARKRFGNATRVAEQSLDVWGFVRSEEISRDLSFAFRRLRQRPGFTCAVVGVMAIGIGATTAMFSAVDAALLRPLPFLNPGELVTLPFAEIAYRDNGTSSFPHERNFEIGDAREMHSTFSSVAAYGYGALNLAERDHPKRVNVGMVTPNFFHTLGVSPSIGRAFSDDEGKPSGAGVVILSHGTWQREFGGRTVLGLSMMLGEKRYQIVGVMPAGFSFPRESDVWVPMTVPNTFATFELYRTFIVTEVIGRLAPNVSISAAATQLIQKWEQVREHKKKAGQADVDETTQQMKVQGAVRPMQRELVRSSAKALYVLLGATGLLLLVACVNVTNLLLSNASARQREIAVRQVLGATRTRIVRQLLTESVVLSLSGALVGLCVAPIALSFIRALMPRDLAGIATAEIDIRVLIFAATLSVITGIAFGLWPAIGSTKRDASAVIKSGNGFGSTSAQGGTVRRILIAGELGLTVMLLVGAGLMLRSFQELVSRDYGLRTENVGTLEMTLPRATGSNAMLQRIDAILSRLASMPDIQSAGVINDLPLSGIGGAQFRIKVESASPDNPADPTRTYSRSLQASGGYFPAMGITLLRGRLLRDADDSLAPKVAVIDAKMAARYWPNVDPIGQTFRSGSDTGAFTVVGVVSDVRESYPEDEPGMQMYFPMHSRKQYTSTFALVVRSSLPEKQLLARMTGVVQSLDPSQAVFNVRMMDDVVSKAFASRRTNTVLIAAFAGLALVLAAVGVYAVVAYGVSHRSRELGIRSALGATGANLVSMISREIVSVTVAGVAIGLLGAWMLSKTLASLIYGVQVHDMLTFFVVPIVLVVPTAIATLVPAHRATCVNPAEVIRTD